MVATEASQALRHAAHLRRRGARRRARRRELVAAHGRLVRAHRSRPAGRRHGGRAGHGQHRRQARHRPGRQPALGHLPGVSRPGDRGAHRQLGDVRAPGHPGATCEILAERGVEVLPTGVGDLACGEEGAGRMASARSAHGGRAPRLRRTRGGPAGRAQGRGDGGRHARSASTPCATSATARAARWGAPWPTKPTCAAPTSCW